jgi:hypothetical protein
MEQPMDHKLTAKLLAAAIAMSPIPFVATTTPAAAQANFSISFGYFYDELSPYGQWYRHPRWGDVWRPTRVERDFRPYYRGYWAPTREYGWMWESDYPFGDITFHYGRWVYDRYDGWLWVPGYVWAPSWVVWRSSGDYIGWFPMPPDDRFLAGYEDYRGNWNNWDRGFGYADWYGPQYGMNLSLSFWSFVDRRHFADRDYFRYSPPQNSYRQIINNSTNITNYTTVNNYIVNRSVDVGQIERASGRRIEPIAPQQVFRAPITPVNVGTQVQTRERRFHGGDPAASPQARVAVLPPNAAREPIPRDQRNGPFNNQQGAPPQQANPNAPPTEQRNGPFGRGFGRQQEQGAQPGEQPRRGGGPGFARPNQEPNPPPQAAPNRQEQAQPPNEQVRRGGFGGFGRPNQESNPPPQAGPNPQEQAPPPNEQVRRGGPAQFARPNQEQPPQTGPNRPEQGPPQNEQARRGPPPNQEQAPQPPPDENSGRGRGNRRGAENQPAPNAPPAQLTQREQGRPPEAAPPARQLQQPAPQAQQAPQQAAPDANQAKADEERNRARRGRGRDPQP